MKGAKAMYNGEIVGCFYVREVMFSLSEVKSPMLVKKSSNKKKTG